MSDSPDGVLVVDKPSGPTSHDVVQVARRTFGARVGHTGTLDPLASGVLPLVVGRATRLAQFLSGAVKGYDATIVFGRETDTGDAAGRTIAETGGAPDADALAEAVARLRGRMLQTPPAYSAKKVGGEAAHRLARRAAPVALAPVEVEIHEASLLDVHGLEARVRLEVSAGFYVRALARDLGQTLGVGAHLGALRRTHAGPFTLDQAAPWPLVVAGGPALTAAVVPMEQLLPDLPVARLSDDAVRRVRQGQRVTAPLARPAAPRRRGVRLVDPAGHLVGIGDVVAPGPTGTAEAALLQPVVILV